MTPEIQRALLQVWAKDIGHVVDHNKSPKAEFARLAKAKGWSGGSMEWCRYWTKCFNETYSWGLRNRSTTTATIDAHPATQTSTIELTDHVRKLSVGSDASSFSVISRTSRANSFDSVRSLNSDQSHDGGGLRLSVAPRSQSIASSPDSTDSRNTLLSLDTVKSLDELSGGVEIQVHNGSIATHTVTDDGDTDSDVPGRDALEMNPAWNDFTNFVHRPNAPFKEEFERLSCIKGWDRRTKRQNLVALLRTEVEFYWSSENVNTLEYYQYLCREMGIEHVPSTVTQARKALRPLKVNLYSVIDHMRNPDIKVITYKSIRELRLSVQKMGTFPRECAKAGGGYMAALLSKL